MDKERYLEVLKDSEKWRKAGVGNFYRKSIVLAAVLQPGILMRDLGKAMGLPSGSIATAVRALEKQGLVRKENIFIKKQARRGEMVFTRSGHKVSKLYPTPYAKDLAAIPETV